MALRPVPPAAPQQPTRLRRTGTPSQRRRATSPKSRRRKLFGGVEQLEDRALMAIAIPVGGVVPVEDFNLLANTGTSSSTPTGWEFVESGTNANLLYAANNGGSNTADTYSYGTSSTDRAFGGLRSGSLIPTFGASYVNNTGGPIASLAIAYAGEQYRLGTSGRGADRIDFQYSLDATSLTSGSWIDVDALDFSSPITTGTVGGVFGTTPVSSSISSLNIANGATFWIRWMDFDAGSSDDGLAIDNFSLTASPPPNTAPTIGTIAALATRSYEPVTTATFTINDAQTPLNSLNITYTSSNTTLVPVANITTGGTGGSRTATIRPAGASGTSTITARVTDGGGLFAESSFVVTVNAAPTLDIGEITGNPGDVIQIPIRLNTNGVVGQPLTDEIQGIDMAILYDTNVLTLRPNSPPNPPPGPASVGADLNALYGAGIFSAFGNSDVPGQVSISISTTFPIINHFNGVIAVINATIKSTAPAGPSAINMVKTADFGGPIVTTFINEDRTPSLLLGPDPTAASNDPYNDGLVTVGGTANQPPVNTVPLAAVAGFEDTNVALSGANLISVADTDSASVTTTVSVTNNTIGTFTATSGGGATPVFSNNNATVSFTGSPAQVNLALTTLTFVPAANRNSTDGTLTVNVSTTDGTTPDNDSFTINLTPVNDAPSFTVGANQSVNEDAGPQTVNSFITVSSPGGGSDESGQTLTYNVSNSSNGLFTGGGQPSISSSGVLTYTPALNANGSATITVSVSDNGSPVATSATQTFTITVNAVNDTPSFTVGSNQTVNEDAGPQTVNSFITVSSPGGGSDESGQTLTYNVSNSNNGLFTGGGQPSISSTGVLTYTPALNANGSATITVSVSDNGSPVATSTTQTFTITVNAVNDAPLFTVGPNQTVPVNSPAQTVSGWATGISTGAANESQTLTFEIVTNTNAGLFSAGPTIASDGTLQYTPQASTSGTATITIRLRDSGGVGNGGVDVSGNQQFTITVLANAPPVNTFPAGPIAGTEDTNVSFTAGNTISVADADSASVTTTVSVPSNLVGTFSAASGGGSVTPVFTNSNATVTFTGSPAQVNLALATLVFVPAANRNTLIGTTTVTINTTDGTTPDNDTFSIPLAAVNDTPSFTVGANQTVNEDAGPQTVNSFITVSSPGGGSDESGQTLTYNVSNNNNGLFLAGGQPSISSTGVLTYTPALNANGSATITVSVSDNGSPVATSTTQTFTITVNAVNDTPSFTVGANQTVNEDAGPQTVNSFITVSSPGGGSDESGQTLTYNVSNNNNGLFLAGGQPSISSTGVLTYTAALNANGSATITVSVSDNGSPVATSATQTFTITVNAVNDTPSFTVGANQAVNEDSGPQTVNSFITVSSPGGGSDESGQTLTYNVSNSNNGLFLAGGQPSISSTGVLTYTPALNANGVATITVSVSDNGSPVATSATQTFTITVNAVNDTPSFTVGANQTVNEDAGPQTVNSFITVSSPGGGSDESGQTLTYNVSNSNNGLFTGGGQPSISSTGVLTYTPALNANGVATITVSVSDNGSPVATSTTQTFTITVNAVNDTPSFTVGANQTVNEDAGLQTVNSFITVSSPGGGSDETGQALAYNVSNNNNVLFLPGGQPSISSTGVLTYTPAANANGVATITVSVSDNGSPVATSATQTFTITVNSVNDAPSFTVGANQSVAFNSPAQTVNSFITTFSTGPSNESGQTVTYTVTNDFAGLFAVGGEPAISSTGVLTYTPRANTSGTAVVSVRIVDSGGVLNGGVDTSAIQTFTITVNSAVNTAPVNTFPLGPVAGFEDTNLPLTGPNLLSVADDSAAVTTVVSVPNTTFGTFTGNEGGGTVTMVFSNGNATVTIIGPASQVNLALATLVYVPVPNFNGSNAVVVSLQTTDGAFTDSDSFTINLAAVNDAPSYTKGANPSVNEDAGLQSVLGFITSFTPGPTDEAGQGVQAYTVTNLTGAALFAVAPAVATNGTLSYTLNPNVSGVATFELRVQDNGGIANGGVDISPPQIVTITVNAINDAPTFTAGTPPTILEDAGAQSVSGFITGFSPGPGNDSGQVIQAYQITNISNPAFFSSLPTVSNAGLLQYTVAANVFGTVTFELRAQDNGGIANGGVDTSAPQLITITVTGVNDAPSFTAGTPATILEDAGAQSVSGFITAFNPGPNEAATQAIGAYQVANISNPSFFSSPPVVTAGGVLQYTVAANTSGTVTFDLRAQDNGGTANSGVDLSPIQPITITVTGVNDAPSITLGTAPAVLEDAVGTQSVPGFVTSFNPGPNESGQVAQSYLITNISNPSLFASGPAIAANGTLTYTLNPNANGSSTFDVRVVDNGGVANGGVDTSVAAVVGTINVTAVNDAPTFTAGTPPTVLEDTLAPQSVPGFITAYSNGPANENLQALQGYLVANISNPAFFATPPAVSNTGTLTYTLNPNVFGTVTFELRAQDNNGTANGGVDTSALQTITITVTGVNDAPTFTANTPPTILEDAGAQTVSGFITAFNAGPNESSQAIQAYLISNISNPSFFSAPPTVSNAGVLQYTVAGNQFGTVTFELRAQDNGGTANSGVDTSAMQLITITVTGVNDAPSLTLGTAPAVLEDAVGTQSVPGFVTSFNAGPNETQAVQSYQISNVSNPSLFATGPTIATNGTLSYTLNPQANGSATFEVRVVDDGGTANSGVNTSAAVIGTINVTAVNDAPTFTAGTPPTILEDAGAQTVNGFVTAYSNGPANENGQAVQAYLISNISNPSFFSAAPTVSNSGVLQYTVAANQFGTVTFELRAQDNGGVANSGSDTSAMQLITITVTGVNDAPSITAGVAPAVLEDAAGTQTVPGYITSFNPGTNESGQVVQNYLIANISNPSLFASGPSIATNGTLSYTLAANANGASTFEIRVVDNGGTANGGSDTSTAITGSINVTAVNDVPTFTVGPSQTVAYNATAQTVNSFIPTFAPGPSNESLQGVTFTVTNDSSGLFTAGGQPAISPSGVLTYTPRPNTSGTATVSVQIVDSGDTLNGGQNTSAIQTFTITVSEAPVNTPPTINTPATVTILEDAGLQTVSLTGISAGGSETQALTITASSADPLIIPTPTVIYTTGATGSLTFTPVANAHGTTTITITVRDAGFDGTPNNSDDATRQVSFTVNVTAVNDVPTFVAGAAPTVLEDAPAQSQSGFVTSFSPGPNEATQAVQGYLVSNISNPSFFAVAPAVSTAGTLTYTLAANANGSVTFELRAQDNGGTANSGVDTSAMQLITINVTPVNDAPSFTAGSPPTIVEDAPQQVINGFVSSFSPGPANESIQGLAAYLVSNISNPAFFAVAPSVASNGTLVYTVAAGASGTVTFDLRAQDNGGTTNGGIDTSPAQTITINVTGVNDAPSFTAGTPPTVLEDAPAQTVNGFVTSFSPGAGESSQSIQAYLVSNISNPAFFSTPPAVSNTGALTYTLAANANGTVTFELRAQDNGGTANGGVDTSAPQLISITVTPVNDAPTVTTITPPTVVEDAPQQVVSGFATFSPGPPNESVQGLSNYLVSNISNPAFFAVAPAVFTNGTLTYTLAANMSGTVTFDLRAQDNGGTANGGVDTSVVQTVTITVTGVNDAPSFTAGTPPTVLEDAPAQTVNGFITGFSPGTGESSQAIQAYLISSISNPAFFTVAPAVSNTGTLTYTLAPHVNGTVTFEVRAQDNGDTAGGGIDTSAPQTITLTVTAVNDAPTLTLGTAPTVLEDAPVQTVNGYVTSFSPGPNESGQTIQSYTITNVSNPSLFASGPTIASNGSLSYTLAANANGSSTFEVRAVDNGGTANGGVNTSAPVIGTITVTPVNDAPSFGLSANPTIAYNSPAQSSAGFATAISSGPANEAGQTLGFNVSVASNPSLFLVAPSIAPNGTLTYTPAANVSGTATINVSLTDNGGTASGGGDTSATQQFTITIQPAPVNNPPTISSIGNVVISEDAGPQTVTFSGVTTGGETETLIITASSSDPTIVPNPSVTYFSPQATGNLNFTPVANANGTVTITVSVRDPGLDTIPGNSDDGITSTTFTVTVTPVNDLPNFTVGANQSVNEDSGLQTVNSWASAILAGPPNEAGQVLTFNIVGNTNPTLFSAPPAISPTGVLSYAPAPNANGTATISVTLSDIAGGTTGVQTFQITVNPVNDAPSFVVGANQSVPEDSGAQNVPNWATSLSAGPADESSQSLTFNISGNSNPSLFSAQPTVLSNGTLQYTPAANAVGSATITLNVSDSGGTDNGGVNASGSQTFTITVNQVNDPPSFVVGASQTVLEDAGLQTVNSWASGISAGPANEAGQTVLFNIVGVSNPSLFSTAPAISPTGVLTYTPAPNANGSATITVSLSDNGGGTNTSPTQTFQISVTPVNDAPSFLVGASQTVNEDANSQIVLGWATALSAGPLDEAGQALTFQVTGNSNPALFASPPTVHPNGTLSYTPAANASGTATITLNVMDNGGTANGGINASGSQTFTISVNDVNDPPNFVAGANQTVWEDAGPQTVSGWATSLSAGPANEVGQTLSFAVTNNTNTGLFATQPAISPTGTLTYTPAANANGTATISVQLNDSAGGSSTIRTFTITVQPVNDAPSFTAGGNQTALEDSGNQSVNGWATGISAGPVDESSQSLTFVVTGNTNAGLFATPPSVTPAGTLSYTPAANASGSATITLVLQDNGGTANGGVNTSTPVTFTISVTPVNDPPDATDSQFNTIVNTPVSGTVSVSDPDGPTLTYALQMLPVLGTVTAFSTSTGAFTYTPTPGATGLDLFTFSVSDGTTTDTATVRIVIGSTTPIVISSGGNLQVIGTGVKDTVIVSPGPSGQVQVRTDTDGVNSSGFYPLTGTISVTTGDGDDYIVVSGVTNATTVDAGAGNDYVSTGTGNDVIIGGTGDDRINASSGNNTVWGDEVGQQDLVIGGNDILSSLGGNDVMYGGGGDDQIYPGDGADYVYAGQGQDIVSSGGGNDRIFGGAGNDTLVGDAGDDVISGGTGNDFILGSDGHDLIIGGAGGTGDSIDGGGGNDLLIAGDTNNSVSSQASDANDVALMALLAVWNATHVAGLANGIVLGDDGAADTLTGGTGDDDFYALANDVLNDFNAANMGTDRRFP